MKTKFKNIRLCIIFLRPQLVQNVLRQTYHYYYYFYVHEYMYKPSNLRSNHCYFLSKEKRRAAVYGRTRECYTAH